MRISDWSSDVCSSDLNGGDNPRENLFAPELIGVAVRFAIGQYVGKVVVPEFEAALPPQGLEMVVARRGVYIERGDVKRLAFESPVRSLAPNKNGGIALLITLLNVFGKPFLAHGQAQNRSPLKQGQLFCAFGGLLRDLHSARTSADDGTE